MQKYLSSKLRQATFLIRTLWCSVLSLDKTKNLVVVVIQKSHFCFFLHVLKNHKNNDNHILKLTKDPFPMPVTPYYDEKLCHPSYLTLFIIFIIIWPRTRSGDLSKIARILFANSGNVSVNMSDYNRPHTKFIFVTGGVVSSLGKGIIASGIGALLENRGLKVALSKADPYINVDPGTMNPAQHGEVFVTDDGAETDMDIGHYERFTKAKLSSANSFSTGQVYDAVLNKERQGDYHGGTVQVVPHITQEIKRRILLASEGADISIIEIGGTVGDIEGQPYLEAIRQLIYEFGRDHVICIHLVLIPWIAAAKELKTKPAQHSVKELRSAGIQPDILICRADREVPNDLRDKIALFCNVSKENVIEAKDVDSIYRIPLILHQQGLDQIIIDRLNIWARQPELLEWKQISERLDTENSSSCCIAVIGKYTDVVDSYKSIEESLIHAGIFNQTTVRMEYIDASLLQEAGPEDILPRFDALIVPGGFGDRGIEGKIEAIRYARENKVPFLGICLGLQLAAIEFARNVIGLKNANGVEFDPDTVHPVIHLMESQKNLSRLGGTMRLGAYPCSIFSGTRAREAYKQSEVTERHRHRFEFNNEYRQIFEDHGMIVSGQSPDGSLVEIMEIPGHPWFISCQFHPELKSRPMKPHPLFELLVKKAMHQIPK